MRLPILTLGLLVLAAAGCVGARSAPVVPVAGIRAKLLFSHDGYAEVQLVLDPHAEVVTAIKEFVRRNAWQSVHFVGLGACTDATIGYYDPATKSYVKTTLTQQMEIVSLIGDAAQGSNDEGFHAHIGLGFADATTPRSTRSSWCLETQRSRGDRVARRAPGTPRITRLAARAADDVAIKQCEAARANRSPRLRPRRRD